MISYECMYILLHEPTTTTNILLLLRISFSPSKPLCYITYRKDPNPEKTISSFQRADSRADYFSCLSVVSNSLMECCTRCTERNRERVHHISTFLYFPSLSFMHSLNSFSLFLTTMIL